MIFVGRLLHEPDEEDLDRITFNLQYYVCSLYDTSGTLLLVHPVNDTDVHVQKTIVTRLDAGTQAWVTQL
jgi:hypothetical protein